MFMKCLSFAVVVTLVGSMFPAASGAEPANLTFYQFEQTADAVSYKSQDGETVLRYQLKGGAEKKLSVESGCYFHPFATPAGVTVTEVAPDDHPHHRGIFLAFVEMHGEKDADFWGWGEHAPKDGRVIVNRSVIAGGGLPQTKSPEFVADNEWIAEGQVMLKERLVVSLTRPDPRTNVLDLTYTLTPTADVTLSRWAFSGFCVRTRKDAELTAFGPKGEVKLPNPSHVKPDTDWPAQAWYAYELGLKGDVTAGVAVIDHPRNPPVLWHNHRDIRMLNPSIVAPAAVKLRGGPGAPGLVLRYRVVAYDGRTPTDELNRMAKEFAKFK
ncbi:MAG: DUF6807 family protein [Pirellulales bacterium]